MKVKHAPDGHNASGTPLSHRGHVICQTCGKDADDLDRETVPREAYCLVHRHVAGAAVRRG